MRHQLLPRQHDLRGASTNGGCGFFDHILNGQNQVVGGTVVIFQYVPATETRPQIDCSPDYTQIIAHELGHALGLGNSTCDGYLMGPGHTQYRADGTLEQYPSRSIKSAECFGANKQWLMSPPDGSETSPPEPQPATEPPNNCWNCLGDTPILIDLDDASYRLTGVEDGVRFDLNATGTRDMVSWTPPGRHTAFLARDVDHDGSIGSGSELFGSATMLRNGARSPNGFEALRKLDDDRDGYIDVHDAVWQDLLLWEDLNHDGLSQVSELTPIAASRIMAISLDYRWSGRHDEHGNQLRYRSMVRLTEGARVIYDVSFVRAPQ